jgi:hypothetical protein
MRPVVAFGLALLASAVGLITASGTATASTGTLGFPAVPALTAWNADAFTIDLYAMNMDVDTQCLTDPNDENSPTADCGAGAFEVTLAYDQDRMDFLSAGAGPWLSSTGRPAPFCFDPVEGVGTVQFRCVTFGAIPMGPQGSGIIASFTFDPDGTAPETLETIDITDAEVTDITGQPFPVSVIPGTVEYGYCTDVAEPLDGTIDLSDAVDILQHFGESVPPANIKYDPTRDGIVDLSDAIYALRLFGQSCVA